MHTHNRHTQTDQNTSESDSISPPRYSKQGPEWSESRNTRERERRRQTHLTHSSTPLLTFLQTHNRHTQKQTHAHTLFMIAQSPRLICENSGKINASENPIMVSPQNETDACDFDFTSNRIHFEIKQSHRDLFFFLPITTVEFGTH